jgi:formate hydrogenlyase subunit 3/multisubunit Na+/H+ antiporter MnhD subunit
MRTRDMRKITGLARRMPVIAVSALIAAFSLAGTPPMAGFISEWTLFAGGIQSGNFVLTLITLVLSLITAAYMLLFIRKVFFGPMSRAVAEAEIPPPSMRFSIAFLAVMSIIFGLFPGLLLDVIVPAITHILGIVGGGF